LSNKDLLSSQELNDLLKTDPAGEIGGEDLKLRLVLDFPVEISVRLGEAAKSIGELLDLSVGTIIELDRCISEPVDLVIGGKVFALGEVVTIGEYFGVRITSIAKLVERINKLR